MKIVLFIVFFTFSIHSFAGECNQDETLIASCDLKGKTRRVAAICLNKKTEHLYYSFNNNGRVELSVDFTQGRKLKRWVDRWTYTTYFGFIRGGYSYVLGVPEERPDAVAFLDLKKNGNSLSLIDCRTNSFGEKDVKNKNIDDIPDDEVRDNGFNFP
ncbi:hypothetical protein [Klebsiella michiganensis]|uniref:hypothetical protein n=1 Tax=Klebsiella michiganensis TaxID=1134687 RepID=UPI003F4FBFEC